MLKHHAAVRDAANRIGGATGRVLAAYREGLLEHEPTITERLVGRIDEVMDGYEANGIRWRVKTLTPSGSGSQEKRYGADVLGILTLDLSDYAVGKGYLAQAKRLDSEGRLRRQEFTRLKAQCDKMLDVTPEAFVFFYEHAGFSVVPALAVVSASDEGPLDRRGFYTRSLASFFRNHLECFVGDRALSAPTIAVMEDLRSQRSARQAYLLSGTSTA